MLLTLIFTIVFSPSGIQIRDNILAYENASLANTILTQGFFLVVSVILMVLGMKPRNWLIHNGVTCTSGFLFLNCFFFGFGTEYACFSFLSFFLGGLVAFDPARNWRQPQEQPMQQQQQMVAQQYNLAQLSSYEPEKRTFWCVLWLRNLVFGWYIPCLLPLSVFFSFSFHLFFVSSGNWIFWIRIDYTWLRCFFLGSMLVLVRYIWAVFFIILVNRVRARGRKFSRVWAVLNMATPSWSLMFNAKVITRNQKHGQ